MGQDLEIPLEFELGMLAPPRAKAITPPTLRVQDPAPREAQLEDPASLGAIRLRERVYRWSAAAADAIAAAAAILLAIGIDTQYSVRPGYLVVMPVVVLIAKIQGLYDHDDAVIRKTTVDEMPRLFNLATLITLLFWISRHFIVIGAPSTVTLLKLWIGLIVLLTVARVAARAVAARISPSERCFFIGDIATGKRVASKLEHAGKTVELVGGLSDPNVALTQSTLAELVDEFEIHRLIIASSGGMAERETNDVVRSAKALGIRVTIAPGELAAAGSALVIDDAWGMPMLGVPRFGLSRSSALLKRAFDSIGAGVILLFVSPFLALAAAAIKLESSGPVFFRQRRVGRDDERFEIVKLRTMVADAEVRKAALRTQNEADGIFKMVDDPRITRVGKLLRKTSLDELPQLINVLKGEMSLVGPRPLVLDEDEKISGHDRRRLITTPGMTGPWQILGSARVPLHEMIKLDYLYVANWSLWSDVKILLRTFAVVAGQRGM